MSLNSSCLASSASSVFPCLSSQLKDTVQDPSAAICCEIISTLIPSSPRMRKHSATAFPSDGTFRSVKIDISSWMPIPVTGISSTTRFSFTIISLFTIYVPLLLSFSKAFPKNNFTLYFFASSTALVSTLSAPRLVISIISS